MGIFINFEDLSPLATVLTEDAADVYIEDIEALAIEAAPCIVEDGFPYANTVKAILRQAVLRWHRAGEGGLSSEQMTSGPFSRSLSFDNRSGGEGRLWPSEERRLQALCRRWKSGDGARRKAFTYLPGHGVVG